LGHGDWAICFGKKDAIIGAVFSSPNRRMRKQRKPCDNGAGCGASVACNASTLLGTQVTLRFRL
jgi:hypothetical protein